MKPYGNGQNGILFIGSQPGKKEDSTGKQLIGDCGIYFKGILRKAGIDPEEILKTNAVRCHHSSEIEKAEVEACRIFLNQVIEEHKPSVIVPMGSSAIYSIIGQEWSGNMGGFQQWVDFVIPSRKYNAWICPVYHPEWILEKGDEVLHLLFQQQLERVVECQGTRPDITWNPADEVEVLYDPKEVMRRIRKYRQLGGTIAFDYETTGLKPDTDKMEIVSNSICWNGEETIAYMMDDPGVISATKRILEDPTIGKIASNLKFEERWTRKKLGVTVENWAWDTMLAAHTLDNRRGICSVKVQAYIRYGIEDYNSHIHSFLEAKEANDLNEIRKLSIDDLLLYNGLDSLLEYRVAVDQMRECGLPWVSEKAKKTKRKRRERGT